MRDINSTLKLEANKKHGCIALSFVIIFLFTTTYQRFELKNPNSRLRILFLKGKSWSFPAVSSCDIIQSTDRYFQKKTIRSYRWTIKHQLPTKSSECILSIDLDTLEKILLRNHQTTLNSLIKHYQADTIQLEKLISCVWQTYRSSRGTPSHWGRRWSCHSAVAFCSEDNMTV